MSKAIDKDKEKLADRIMKHNGYMAENQGDDVSDKCEWKKGKVINSEGDHKLKFYPCEDYGDHILREFDSLSKDTLVVRFNFCPFCGADIQKPEQKPLIVKSGGTWVANWKGVDYLCSEPDNFEKFDIDGIKKQPDRLQIFTNWKPFSEITLTDEIAKLRPMVSVGNNCTVCENERLGLLIRVKNSKSNYDKSFISEIRGRTVHTQECRLATPKELRELS